jgi:hypothetical protein
MEGVSRHGRALRFVARLLEGEKMAPLRAEFGISRKIGYQIFDRYKNCGVQAFSDRSHRAAHREANRLPAPIEATIVRVKREYPGWGAPKIREKAPTVAVRFAEVSAKVTAEACARGANHADGSPAGPMRL